MLRTPGGPSTRRSASCSIAGGVSSERTPTHTAVLSRPSSTVFLIDNGGHQLAFNLTSRAYSA